MLSVGAELIRLEVEGEGDAEAAPAPAVQPRPQPKAEPPAKAPAPRSVEREDEPAAPLAAASRLGPPRPAGEKPIASPALRRRAREAGVDLRQVRGSGPAGRIEHADLDASYVFQCAQPARLATLDVAIFDVFKRVKRIDVQVVGPKGQSKVVLRPPARRVPLIK